MKRLSTIVPSPAGDGVIVVGQNAILGDDGDRLTRVWSPPPGETIGRIVGVPDRDGILVTTVVGPPGTQGPRNFYLLTACGPP